MADIVHKDPYKILDASATLGVAVRVPEGHSVAFLVLLGGMPIPVQADGFVPLGVGSSLRGRKLLVLSNVTKITPGKLFTVVHDMRETSAGSATTTMIPIQADFEKVNTVDVEETITFE